MKCADKHQTLSDPVQKDSPRPRSHHRYSRRRHHAAACALQHIALGHHRGIAGSHLPKSSGAFIRKIDGGRQELGLSLVDYNPLFVFSLILCIRLEAVQEITNRFFGSLPEYHGISVTSVTQLEHLGLRAGPGGSVDYRVKSEADLTAILPRVLTAVRERVLPFFEEYRDIAAVNRGLNPKGAERVKWLMRLFRLPELTDRREFDATNLPYRAMTGVAVAHLARDPRLAALITAYRSQVSAMPEPDRQKFESLVDYLSAAGQ